jgi:hypothetical protein
MTEKVENLMDKIQDLIDSLSKLENEFLLSSQRILNAGNRKLYALDLLANAVNNRAIQLMKGFVTLIKDDNFISAVPLIRLQLDNGMRFFATTLVSDYNDLFMHFLDGKPLKKFKDAKGKPLTDIYLATKLNEYFPGTLELYKSSSGYIHLSERHLFATIVSTKKSEMSISQVVGGKPDTFTLMDKTNFTYTMYQISKLVLIVVEQWKHQKDKISKILHENNLTDGELSE